MEPLPPYNPRNLRRVALLFSGGPAPAANAVISTAAVSFIRHHIDVVGVLNGYSNLVKFGTNYFLQEGRDYVRIDHKMLKRTRNTRGILIGTARTNPGSDVKTYEDLKDPAKTTQLRTVYEALRSIQVDALISIGGDDTLKTANKFARFQKEQLPDRKPIAVVHIPKTIDNDYAGIDFTFGYFTAVETMAVEIQNLLADAEATRSYYVVETMGRYAGWLAYGAAIAGEASLVLSVEDLTEPTENLLEIETVELTRKDQVETFQSSYAPYTQGSVLAASTSSTAPDGTVVVVHQRRVVNFDRLISRLIDTMLVREREGKAFGVFALAEGIAEYLPWRYIKDAPRDPHGHLSIAHINFAKRFAKLLSEAHKARTGKDWKITGVSLGYEARCSTPHAFDVMLGSALGVGAYRALVEQGRDEVMVSTAGQLDLRLVPFSELIDPSTMTTSTRYIRFGSDFHQLARFLETYVVD